MADGLNATLAAKYRIPIPNGLDSRDLVVVIEDQTDLRLIMSHQIQKLSVGNVRAVANGYDAIEMIKNENLKVSIFVCDMDMPVMGGLNLLSELRENPKLDRAPFCLMMDGASKEKLMLAVETGVDEILVKPFTPADMGPKIRAAYSKFHNPINPERVYELAKQALRVGKLDAAQGVYFDLAQTAPNAARPWVGLARIEVERKNHDGALKHLAEAEKRNPNYVHLYVERARIHSLNSQWDAALAGFRKAIDLSPLNAARYKDAAEILFRARRYQEANDLLEIALKHELAFADLFHYLSQAKFALKDFKNAQRHIRQALASHPEHTDYLNQLGICLKETNQLDEAVKVYNQVIKLDPANQSALYNKAVLLHSKGDIAEAVKLLERIAAKFPEFQKAHAKLEEYRKELPAA